LCADSLVGDGVALEGWGERGGVGRYCRRHLGGCSWAVGVWVVQRLQDRMSWYFYMVDRLMEHVRVRCQS
jgi:hypothetical protein